MNYVFEILQNDHYETTSSMTKTTHVPRTYPCSRDCPCSLQHSLLDRQNMELHICMERDPTSSPWEHNVRNLVTLRGFGTIPTHKLCFYESCFYEIIKFCWESSCWCQANIRGGSKNTRHCLSVTSCSPSKFYSAAMANSNNQHNLQKRNKLLLYDIFFYLLIYFD